MKQQSALFASTMKGIIAEVSAADDKETAFYNRLIALSKEGFDISGMLDQFGALAVQLLNGTESAEALYEALARMEKVTGVKMKTSTGWMSIDLTDVINAYVKDGATTTMRLWGYGTGGSTTNSNFRGYSPSSSYTSQRPYLALTYNDATVWYNNSGTWTQCMVYYCDNGTWQPVLPYYNSGGSWLLV